MYYDGVMALLVCVCVLVWHAFQTGLMQLRAPPVVCMWGGVWEWEAAVPLITPHTHTHDTLTPSLPPSKQSGAKALGDIILLTCAPLKC